MRFKELLSHSLYKTMAEIEMAFKIILWVAVIPTLLYLFRKHMESTQYR